MVERWERYKHTTSLLLTLLLLLIVVYDDDGVVTYNETTIMDWYVEDDDDDVGLCQQLVEFVIMSVPILSNKDNYSTFIPNSYVSIGGAGD